MHTLIYAPASAPAVYPYGLAQLRADNPNVSFSVNPTAEDLAPFDVFPVTPTDPPPECDPRTERVEDTLQPQQADDGTWHQAWTVRPATAEEIAAWDAANQLAPDWAAFKATALGSASLNQILAAAYQAAPVAAGALPLALAQAQAGGPTQEFAAAWAEICAAVAVEPAAIERFQQAARACHLPAEFVEALRPATEPV